MGRYEGGEGSKMAKNWQRCLWMAPMWKSKNNSNRVREFAG